MSKELAQLCAFEFILNSTDMSDLKERKAASPTLDYSTRRPLTLLERWLLRPLGWKSIVFILLIVSIPYVMLACDPSTLMHRRGAAGVWTFVVAVFLIVFYEVRKELRRALARRLSDSYVSEFVRFVVVAGLVSLMFWMQQRGAITTIVFWIYSNQFAQASNSIGMKVPAGQIAPTNLTIGPFRFDSVARSVDGQTIAFTIKRDYQTDAYGGIIYTNHPGEHEPLYYPHDEFVSMGGGWYWWKKYWRNRP